MMWVISWRRGRQQTTYLRGDVVLRPPSICTYPPAAVVVVVSRGVELPPQQHRSSM